MNISTLKTGKEKPLHTVKTCHQNKALYHNPDNSNPDTITLCLCVTSGYIKY